MAEGNGTWAPDITELGDKIVALTVAKAVELSGTVGLVWRGDPDDPIAVNLSNGVQWGIGAAVPSRSQLRLNLELFGEKPFSDTLSSRLSILASSGFTAGSLATLREITMSPPSLWPCRRAAMLTVEPK